MTTRSASSPVETGVGPNGHVPPAPLEPPRETDLGNAQRFVADHGRVLRYVHPWRRWLWYDGRRWAKDETGEIIRRAKMTVRGIDAEVVYTEDEDRRRVLRRHATWSQAEARIRAMVSLAEPELPVTPEQLDTDPWALNVKNGTIDLRTGELGSHTPDALITKLAPVEYEAGATCPLWQATLERVFAGNAALIAFVQRSVGYALTGDTRERVLFMWVGSGANGKSTILGVLQDALGDYAGQAPTSMLLVKDVDAIPNDIAGLQGVRFAVAAETGEGRRLDEALVKQLTGQDLVTARFMRAEFFRFRPTFKLFLATNHRPIIRGTDRAIWSRIRLVPFSVTIPDEEQDRELGDKLRAELPGILGWAVEGCLVWQRQRLGAVDEIRLATERYRSDMDTLGDFLRERCVLESGAEASAAELYEAYGDWCRKANERPIAKRDFGLQLGERGAVRDRTRKQRRWLGIRLQTATEQLEMTATVTHVTHVTHGDAVSDSSRVGGGSSEETETGSRHVTRHEEEGELPGWMRE